MSNFLRKIFNHLISIEEMGICQGGTDYHSHILPGVDDGVQTIEESIEILNYYDSLGITNVYCTPHIMEDIPNQTEDLRKKFQELCAAYQGSIKLHLSAEYMIDSLLIERINQNDLLTWGENNNHLLVETSYFTAPIMLNECLPMIRNLGLWMVLAHPERYVYMNKKKYEQLKNEGVKFQLNLASLSGWYGNEVMDKAEWLLQQGFYDFWGTDVHNSDMKIGSRKILKKDKCKFPLQMAQTKNKGSLK